ncbi:unnamed protein product [Timema podura]|uniref:Uncharacterized protein n=1 Tax=Timema podura TaxID=61482 RepID=A0ABN7NWG0_TIMPD|nr:unnamed protein product [Timema podura]
MGRSGFDPGQVNYAYDESLQSYLDSLRYGPIIVETSEKKKGKDHTIKENATSRKSVALDSSNSNSNFGLAEDSNTCFSMVSDSQGPTDFSAQLGFSEDSNSQSSEPSSKRLKTD